MFLPSCNPTTGSYKEYFIEHASGDLCGIYLVKGITQNFSHKVM